MSSRDSCGTIAAACFAIMFASMIFMGIYGAGYRRGSAAIVVSSPVYHLGEMPAETPVLALYESGGIVTMTTAIRLDDGRILPWNVYGGSVPYDLMDPPIGWTEIPEGLMEVMK